MSLFPALRNCKRTLQLILSITCLASESLWNQFNCIKQLLSSNCSFWNIFYTVLDPTSVYMGEQRLLWWDVISVNQITVRAHKLLLFFFLRNRKSPSSSLLYCFNYINSFQSCKSSTAIRNNSTIMILIQKYFVVLVHMEFCDDWSRETPELMF